jgi:hypothetical protein
MDDQFLHALRRQPPPEFMRRLRARLPENAAQSSVGEIAPRMKKWLALTASLGVLSLAFTLPAVRAGAEAFLDFFRVVSISGVQFDATRLGNLETSSLNFPELVGDEVEVVKESGPPVSYASLDEAGVAAGLRLLEPAYRPAGYERSAIEVAGENEVRIVAHTAQLQQLLAEIGIADVRIPVELDGQTIGVRVPPIAVITYSNGTSAVRLVEARSPEVSFPAGVDLSALAEAALRLLGLDSDEAYRLATSVDWRNTLIVPVPAGAASFREVNVAGSDGLLIEARSTEDRPGENVLLWATDERVFALVGRLQGDAGLRAAELLEMAQTVQ